MSYPLTTQLSRALQQASQQRTTAQTPDDVVITTTGGALGAVVRGLDGNRPLSPALVRKLKTALDDHHILIFKQQTLSDEAFLAFTTYFGSVFRPPEDIPVLASATNDGIPPDVVPVANVEGGYTGHGELTPHIDHQWTPLPSAGSLLYALEVPNAGGDTSWYNINAAYEALDADTKARIADLQLITYNPFLRTKGQSRPRYRTPEIEPLGPGFPHPLVRTHPSSGKPLLFLSTHTEAELVGVDPAEGAALIARLREHIAETRFRYEHKWEVGDIVYWDNQATLHSRTAFAETERRVLKRVSLAGSRPF
ncbi:Alpha-ketoglutarate-dependent taurine dioxygenase [Andreprevotia sp. IGB-42]|uniref:TauD/TfdA dioxygenase family protein n=1 Tax=Andreprevotia sp. IGB-42 TaxID=2497473 RepID=UPI00135BE8AF|nr:TauD/TfdA family dioxygenase [Andreprevotia sp. IGB-42]KAF0815133.1 Alpha-ketoglutarate-dependent taurine dioxygenase [Andreprevotia sp. IGB-42]